MRSLPFAIALTLLVACRSQGSGAPGVSSSAGLPPASGTPPKHDADASVATAPSNAAQVWSFDADSVGAPPSGFAFGRTGEGRDGKWIVKAESGAPSGANVLAQSDADTTDNRFPVAWGLGPSIRDVDVSVRCKPVSGQVDGACGLVFRLRDADNYYVTRANTLEDNVRLYFVKDGRRQQLASFSGRVTRGAWHAYRVVARGDHIQVYWDDAKVIDHHDGTFPDAGKSGVWTKADSVTYFDDLSVLAL